MKILITGGACAGKTTCIKYIKKYLEDRNFKVKVLEEIPTKMINEGETPDKLGNMNFIKEVIKRQLQQINKGKNENSDSILIYDGSPIDNIKFLSKEELSNILEIYNTSFDEVLNYYDYVIHLESVAKRMPEKYSNTNNKARTTKPEKSAKRDDLLLETYAKHNKRYYIQVYEEFEEKIEKLKDIIKNILEG